MSRIENDNTIGTDCLWNLGYGDPVALRLWKPLLEFDEAAEIVCPYCSKRYLLNPDAPAAGHGH